MGQCGVTGGVGKIWARMGFGSRMGKKWRDKEWRDKEWKGKEWIG